MPVGSSQVKKSLAKKPANPTGTSTTRAKPHNAPQTHGVSRGAPTLSIRSIRSIRSIHKRPTTLRPRTTVAIKKPAARATVAIKTCYFFRVIGKI